MDEPNRLLALRELVKLSAEIEVQLSLPGWEPLKAVLIRAQDEAATALVALQCVDPTNANAIRELQNVAGRYSSLVTWLREIIAEGKDAANEIDEAKAESVREVVVDLDDETRVALGLREPGAGTE